jgi:hypothetical protein
MYDYDAMTMAELEALADRLSDAVGEAIREQEETDARAVAEFEALVANTISLGAEDRATAIKWILDSVDHGGDFGYACYLLGLPYTMEKELAEVLEAA